MRRIALTSSLHVSRKSDAGMDLQNHPVNRLKRGGIKELSGQVKKNLDIAATVASFPANQPDHNKGK
jgi:hypothetical protein